MPAMPALALPFTICWMPGHPDITPALHGKRSPAGSPDQSRPGRLIRLPEPVLRKLTMPIAQKISGVFSGLLRSLAGKDFAGQDSTTMEKLDAALNNMGHGLC